MDEGGEKIEALGLAVAEISVVLEKVVLGEVIIMIAVATTTNTNKYPASSSVAAFFATMAK